MKFIAICCFVTLASAAVVPTIRAEVPLPGDIKISEANAAVGKKLAAFPGRWAGTWTGNLESVLVVETIDDTNAKVIYAWGDAPTWRIEKGYVRLPARVTSAKTGEIEFSSGQSQFTVTMNDDLASIVVTRTRPPREVRTETFKRLP